MTTTVCHNRPQKQRVSLEICEYHTKTKDPVCLRTIGGKGTATKCEIAREILRREGNEDPS